jgi:hypothetical protein
MRTAANVSSSSNGDPVLPCSGTGTEIALGGVPWVGLSDREVIRAAPGPLRTFGSAHGPRILELLRVAS